VSSRGPRKHNFGISKQAGELDGLVWKSHQFFLEWNTFEENYLANDLGSIRAFLQRASITVVVRAPEQESATMVVL
jgi:hypothetical protein